MHNVLRHEIAHGLANLVWGASEVKIRQNGDCLETIPTWPQSLIDDATKMERAVFAGFLAGQLHTDGVDTRHDEMLISVIPPNLKETLWDQIQQFVRPQLEAVSDADLAKMMARMVSDGGIVLCSRVGMH
jgi:hypothetical protein